jgi:Major Facilitator Superfamily
MAPRPDRNFLLLLGDAGLFSVAIVCFDPSVVLTVFMAQFTTSALLIGAPAAIRLAGLYLPQLPAAIGLRRVRRIVPFFFWQAAIGRGALLGLIAAALLAGHIPPELVVAIMLVAWLVFSFTEGAATLAWLDLLGEVIHVRLRATYFGSIQVLGGILAVGAGFGVRAALNEEITPRAFIPLFGWGCLAFLLSVICIGLIREHQPTRRASVDEPTIRHMATLLRGAQVRRISLAQILAGSIQLGLPFYALFARDIIGLGGEWLGGLIVAQTLGGSLAGLVWARIAGRYGARSVVFLSSLILIVIPLCCWAADRVGAGGLMLAAFFLAGAARGGSQAGFWQYILDVVSPADRRMFMGLANTANAPTLLMPLFGGAILEWGGYSWLFGGTAALGLAASLAGLWLPQPAPAATPEAA